MCHVLHSINDKKHKRVEGKKTLVELEIKINLSKVKSLPRCQCCATVLFNSNSEQVLHILHEERSQTVVKK